MSNLKPNPCQMVMLIVWLFSGVFTNARAQSTLYSQAAEDLQQASYNAYISSNGNYFIEDNQGYTGFNYWWNANALDMLTDGYIRTRSSVYLERMKRITEGIKIQHGGGYINDFYDDMEWLSMASLKAYEATGDNQYFDIASLLWEDIKTGISPEYFGAVTWNKGCHPECKNAISNSPAAFIAAKLYRLRGGDDKLQTAQQIHAYVKSKLIDPVTGGVFDSYNPVTNETNTNPDWIFSYNVGMYMAASVELYKVTGNQTYLNDALGCMQYVKNYRLVNNVLFTNESGQKDGGLFKGIFIRCLVQLARETNIDAATRKEYFDLIKYNAQILLSQGTRADKLVGPVWNARPNDGDYLTYSTEQSGVMLLEAAASADKVIVYQDINFGGYSIQLTPGNYTAEQLKALGVNDNDLTSISVPPGYEITVYDNADFTGESATYTTPTGWLGDWNDKVSSLIIAGKDITDLGGNLTVEFPDAPAGEDYTNLIDNNPGTKFLMLTNGGWIQYEASSPYNVTSYSITSANDADERDPLNWTLQGSNDGTNWTNLDTRTGEDFSYRFQKRTFSFNNAASYSFYRLNISNNSGNLTQISELELFASNFTCAPSEITLQASVAGGAWNNVAEATAFKGQNVEISASAAIGNWSWAGPNGFSSASRQLSLSNIQPSQAGVYTVTFTNANGCQSQATFILEVSEDVFSQKIEAESFSSMSGVELENTTDVSEGQNVGYIDTGDWMAYSGINIPSSGYYVISYRVASETGGAQLSLDLNAGSIVLGNVNIPTTGGWQNWTTVTQSVYIDAGTYDFGIFAQTGGVNINWFQIASQTNVELSEVKVFLLGGQSNMVGWTGGASNLPELLKQSQNVQIKVFGNNTFNWGPVRPGLGANTDSFGPELTFAYDIARYYPGENIAIIKGSWPGTNLYDQWRSPSAGRNANQGDLYNQFVQQANQAINELKGQYDIVTIEGMCWMQGESDAETTQRANDYESNLNYFIDDIRNEFNTPNLPFVIGMIDATNAWPYHQTVRNAEINLANNKNNVYTFDTNGYSTDGYHYYSDGYLRMGADFATVMKNHISPNLSDGVVALYQDCGYSGYEKFLTGGNYNLSQLNEAGIATNDISSARVRKGYNLKLFSEDNFGGNDLTIGNESACLVFNNFNDVSKSAQITNLGVTGLSGTYHLKNRFSNLYLELWYSSTEEGGKFVQWPYSGGTNQTFVLEEVEPGTYKITNATSNLSLDVYTIDKRNGAEIVQWTYYGTDNQKFIMMDAGNGYYSLIAKHSGLALEISWQNSSSGAYLMQRGNGTDLGAQWALEPVSGSAAKKTMPNIALAEDEIIYPNPANKQLKLKGIAAGRPVSIFDLSGNLIFQSKNEYNQIDISSLKPGVYFLKTDSDNNKMHKFLKQ